jgi:hypothetical protein
MSQIETGKIIAIEDIKHFYIDNGKEIYFDKEYDTTPYNLLENFSKEQNKLSGEDFAIFISDKLQNKYIVSNLVN